MPQDSPSRHKDQYLVRMPDGLRDRIAEAAKANGRSMNSEIVARLEISFGGAPAFQFLDPKIIDRLNELTELLSVETDLVGKIKRHIDRPEND